MKPADRAKRRTAIRNQAARYLNQDDSLPKYAPNAIVPPPPADDAPETAEAPEEELHQLRFEIKHDLEKRTDLYLRDRLPDYSRNMIHKLIDVGGVIVNGRPAKKSTVLNAGDIVDVTLPKLAPLEAQPENIPLNILYEDDDFIALNKQANLIVHPARGNWSGTLINALLWHAKETNSELSTGSNPWRPGIIHRLDRDTTGLILIAKRDEAHWRIAGQFERRTIKKTYLAIVHGELPFQSDLIDAPLAVHPKIKEKYAVRPDVGKPAQTVYTVVQVFHTPGGTYSLLELAPKTGRTHQLRVHCAHLGHPIVGDTAYGGKAITLEDITGKTQNSKRKTKTAPEEPKPLIERQALHAYRLQFVHPTKFTRMHLEAPPPPDMSEILALLKKHAKKK